jgi:hypothetical protein
MRVVVMQIFGVHPLESRKQFSTTNGERGLAIGTAKIHVVSSCLMD